MNTAKMKRSREDIIFDIVKFLILGTALIVVLYPLYFIIIASISDPTAVSAGKVLIRPVGINFEGFLRIFQDDMIWIGYRNTILYTVVGTLINITLTLTLAYPLSRKDFKFGGFLMIFLLITMYFNGGLIPRYILVKNLGLLDHWQVLVIINAVNVFNVIIARTFLRNSIPESLYEAAIIDGCDHVTFLIKIVLPLSKAIIAVLILYYGVFHWNEYFTSLIYISNEDQYPLQLVLRSILIENQLNDSMLMDVNISDHKDVAESIKYGVIIVSTLPVLVLYMFMQKYFVQGVMIGSVKG